MKIQYSYLYFLYKEFFWQIPSQLSFFLFLKFLKINNYVIYYQLKRSYIKRAVAFPGEHVKIENGKVYINGKELEESYLNDDVVTESRHFNDFIVPDGYIFAMGDNRTKIQFLHVHLEMQQLF